MRLSEEQMAARQLDARPSVTPSIVQPDLYLSKSRVTAYKMIYENLDHCKWLIKTYPDYPGLDDLLERLKQKRINLDKTLTKIDIYEFNNRYRREKSEQILTLKDTYNEIHRPSTYTAIKRTS